MCTKCAFSKFCHKKGVAYTHHLALYVTFFKNLLRRNVLVTKVIIFAFRPRLGPRRGAVLFLYFHLQLPQGALSMKNISSFRTILLTSACAVLGACSGSGNNSNSGSTGSVTIGGGDTGTGSAVTFSFVPSGFTCPTGTTQGTQTVGDAEIEACLISAGTLQSDVTLPGISSGSRVGYLLQGSVFVGENAVNNPAAVSTTLTIEAGAILMGANGEDALIVNPGSQIEAVGTSSQPIVMTSASDAADGSVDDGLVANSRDAKGEWGGLVINGLAKINDCNTSTNVPGTTDCVKTGEGGSGLFGGDDDADDSGTLAYVRVQYAGFEFSGEDELNGIAFQGVGSGTDVSYIQVHNGEDDGVEFYGGTVSPKYVVVTGADDDSIDWTDGWRGDLQYALVVQDNVSNDRAIEADNRGNDVNVGEAEGVVSNPTVSNFTFFGSTFDSSDVKSADGIKLRAGTNANIANGIIVGFKGDGIDFDRTNEYEDSSGAVIGTEDGNATPTLQSIFIAENGRTYDTDGGTLFTASASNVAGAFSTMDGVIPGAAELAVSPTDISTGTTLDVPTFIGAFPGTATNDSNWASDWTVEGSIPGATAAACPAGTTVSADSVPTGRFEQLVCIVPNSIETDITLTAGNLYKFAGSVFVGEDAGPDAANPDASAATATLTIEAGVTVYGENGEDAIIVSRGSQLVAEGTVDAPITLTSQSDVLGTVAADDKGEWGGLVLNGRAPINDCNTSTNTPGTIGCVKTGEGGSGLFGGNEPTDSSGSLEFVVVKYAGFEFSGEDELNGIAFQGVGNGTTVDYIQVHNGEDDGVEFYGGTVDAKHVLITGADDDSIDWTDGWLGSIQYALVVQDDVSNDRAIEADNRGNDVNVGEAQSLVSTPTIVNFTFLGAEAATDAAAKSSDGIKLRAGTGAILANGIVVGFNQGVDFDRSNDYEDATGAVIGSEDGNATPELFSIYVGDNGGSSYDTDGGTLFTASATNVDGMTDRNMNGFIPTATLTGLITPTDVSTLTFPSYADNSADIEAAAYVGAFDPTSESNDDNWATGWSFDLSTANIID